jgi:hypothetical protein
MSDLEERQRYSRLYIDEIGDVIQNHVPRLEMYRFYCSNQVGPGITSCGRPC